LFNILKEYKLEDKSTVGNLQKEIERIAHKIGREIKIMEVCGTHTVSIRKFGIHSLLPKNVRLISGPGCPVCVTPTSYIDHALQLVKNKRAVILTFGDMLKVPGSSGESLSAYMGNELVRVIYSPLEILKLRREISQPIVFLGIGFETTIPTIASVFKQVIETDINNTFLYTSFKTVPPALEVLLADPSNQIDGFLLPGHVSVILGEEPYREILEKSNKGVPGVITGFEPVDIMLGIYLTLKQIQNNEHRVENAYPRAVKPSGNSKARKIMDFLLKSADELWRGLGNLPKSGLKIREEYKSIDATIHFEFTDEYNHEPKGCLCAAVIQGKNIPTDCPHFGKSCLPETPIGPCMVSSEGACAAYYRYGVDRL